MAGARTEEFEKLRKTVRSVLLSSPKGVQLKKFCADYRSLVKESFPWKQLGYSSVVHLLEDMPDVVRFEFSKKHDDYTLFGIADSSCYLPSWLRKAQGTNKPSPSVPPPPPSQPSPAKSSDRRRSNTHGSPRGRKKSSAGQLVAVHVSFKSTEGGQQCSFGVNNLGVTKQRLCDAMSAAGDPRDVYLDSRGFAFVRYARLEEAKKAVSTCSGMVVGGARLVVEPARESKDLFSQSPSQKRKDRGGGWKNRRKDQRKREERRRLREEGGRSEERARVSADASHGHAVVEGDSSVREGGSLPARDGQWKSRDSNAGVICWSPDPSCDYSYSGQSEPGSDLDSDFWDDDLLTPSPLSTDSCGRPVLQEEVPTSCDVASQLELSERNSPLENGLTPARVSLVDSPSIIWLQLTADPETDIARLSQWIMEENPPQLSQVREGQFCALKLLPPQFVRVRVDRFDNCVARQQVTVLWVDTGHTHIVSCHSLHALPPSASLPSVPPLAMPCRLGGVRSTFADGGWYFLDNQLLWMYLLKKKVYVRKRLQSNTSPLDPTLPRIEVDLFLDAAGTESIAECLVRKGLHVARAEPETTPSPAAREGVEEEGGRDQSGGAARVMEMQGVVGTRGHSSPSPSQPPSCQSSLPSLSSSPPVQSPPPLACPVSHATPSLPPSALSPSLSASSPPLKPVPITTSSPSNAYPSHSSSLPPPKLPSTLNPQSSSPLLRLQKLLENFPTKLS